MVHFYEKQKLLIICTKIKYNNLKLCPKCNNPEFSAEKVEKTEIKTCLACGHSRTIL